MDDDCRTPGAQPLRPALAIEELVPADLGGEGVAALHYRIDKLESRLFEQDRMIRHTLTMLIEWIEASGGRTWPYTSQ